MTFASRFVATILLGYIHTVKSSIPSGTPCSYRRLIEQRPTPENPSVLHSTQNRLKPGRNFAKRTLGLEARRMMRSERRNPLVRLRSHERASSTSAQETCLVYWPISARLGAWLIFIKTSFPPSRAWSTKISAAWKKASCEQPDALPSE